MSCTVCGKEIEEGQTLCPECAAPRSNAPSRPRSGVWAALILLLLAAAGGLGYSYWQKLRSPEKAVAKLGDAAKQKDWKTVYSLIAWTEAPTPPMTEDQFLARARLADLVVTLTDYQVGRAKIDGGEAVVPVTITIQKRGLLSNEVKTGSTDVRCRWVDGQWKIAPVMNGDFLGLQKLILMR